MRGDDAYAVLGLRPGAARAEIDQAYRRLIKRYHPDYAGGDAGRAAELNRAYSELRARSRHVPSGPPRPAPVPPQIRAQPPSRWRGVMFGAAAVAAVVLFARSAAMTDSRSSWPQFSSASTASAVAESRGPRAPRGTFSLDEPLAKELIDGSVGDAIRLHAADDAGPAAKFSRECLSRLSANPSVPLFDSCAAYDEAIAILAVGDPAFESGPFNPSAVTARQVGAARLLSADYFEAESRLQQIRSRVHLVLLPQIPYLARSAERIAPVAPPVARTSEIAAVEVPSVRQAPEPRRVAVPSTAAARQRQRPRPQASPPSRPRTAPAAPRAPTGTPARDVQPAPAWQQPIKPAWQRPLPPGEN